MTAQDMTDVGIGLRFAHYDALRGTKPVTGFLEAHSENFFGGGYHLETLRELAADYPISLHGVGLSLGSSEPVDAEHVVALKCLSDTIRPIRVSDHAAWSRSGNAHLGDLLPLPYTPETLRALCDNIARVQDALGHTILIENPSTYLRFTDSVMQEADFLMHAVTRTGCGLLLDLNNIVVQAHNIGVNPHTYLDTLDAAVIGEIHLAGHIEQTVGDATMLIDTHSRPVPDPVWRLYDDALGRFGPLPTLIEWDKDMPELTVLLAEADKAQQHITHRMTKGRRHAVG